MIETKFKNTDIGLIPEDWEVKALENVFDIIPNNTLSRECLNYSKGEYQNVHYGDVLIKLGEYVDCQKDVLPFVNSDCKFNKTILRNGDVVMADTAEDETAGKVTEIVNSDNKKIVSGLHTIPLRPKELFASKFLGYAMNANLYHKQLLPIQSGTKVTSVSKSSIITTKLAYPKSLAEQTRIATALSDIDSLIDSLDKLIQKKRNIKQGAMQELLTGKKRLKGFEKPWVEKMIGEIGYTYNGLTGKSSNDFGVGNSKYITFLNVLNNVILRVDQFEKVDVKPSENQNKAKFGDLFFNTSSETPEEVGICAVLQNDLDNLYLNSFCFGFRLTDKTNDGLFLSYLFRSKSGRDIMTALAQGSTRYNLSKDQFLKTAILLPSTLEEQTAIARILSDMDKEIEALEAKQEKYKSIKEGMMQELLSGRIRLV